MHAIDFTPTPFGDDPRFSGTVLGIDHTPESDPRLHAFSVSFAPGSRTAWHSHVRGQLLICTSGRGTVSTRDGVTLTLEPGTAVWTEPGEEHWHGALADSPMSHIAVQTTDPGRNEVSWQEAVDEEQATA